MSIVIGRQFRWQSEYPNNCPGRDASTIKLEVYRFVKHNPPIEKDFIPYAKEKPGRYTDCNGWGISFFKSEYIMKQMQNNNSRFKNKYIAKGVIDITDGKVKISSSGHINL
ncbi:TPA: hypothetical protein P5K61_000848, partial [Legionella pneumophila]|nr:hypothetical protein [Legionella pneumophila]